MKLSRLTIHLAIAFDQNYLYPFRALINSLFDNNKNVACHFHLIMTGISERQKEEISEKVINNDCKISFYQIFDERINQFTLGNHWTKAAYYRLYFPHLIDDSIKRLVYLDTDTLVIGDISELYQAEMNNFPVAAIYDNYVKRQPLIGIHQEGQYFNSGVLLIDVSRWREQRISEKAFDYLLKFPDRILFVDQCALNAVLIGNWKMLDCRFNLLYSYIPTDVSKKKLKEFLLDKIIVHFTLQRPWNMLCKNRLRSLYFYYLKMSGKPYRTYSDFSFIKIPAWIRLRIIEFYFDNSLLQSVWKSLKLRF